MNPVTYSEYVKNRPLSDLKLMVYMYTLELMNTTKSKYLKILSPFVMTDKVYDVYVDTYYEKLSKSVKSCFHYYEGSGYDPLNKYLRDDVIDISYAEWEDPKQPRATEMFYNMIYPLYFDEYEKFHKNSRKEFIPSEQFMKKLDKTMLMYYEDTLGLYNGFVTRLNYVSRTMYDSIQRTELPHELVVFRGEQYTHEHELMNITHHNTKTRKHRPDIPGTLKKDDLIFRRGFVSCSLNPHVAIDFSGESRCCIFRYFLKKHDPCLLLPGVSGNTILMEYEVILNPHVMKVLRVNNVEIDNLDPSRGRSVDTTIKNTYTIYDVEIHRILPLKLTRMPIHG